MANLAGVLNELQQDRAHLVQQVRRLAGCGKTSISTASAKTTRLSSLMVVACLPPHPPPHSRTAPVTRRPADSPAPSVSSADRALNRYRLLVPKLVANTHRTRCPVLRGVAGF